jgi:hypothetical protein
MNQRKMKTSRKYKKIRQKGMLKMLARRKRKIGKRRRRIRNRRSNL